jgi:hypothetical protein
MTDILNWLQAGSGVAGAVISLGAATAAWKAAKHSEQSAMQSDQTAGAMLRLEKERRHDELDPTRNGLKIRFTHYGGNTSMLMRINRRYKISYDVYPKMAIVHSDEFDYLSEDGESRKILFRGRNEIVSMVIRFRPLSFKCDCSRINDATDYWHWTYSPTVDELKIVDWKPLD